MVENHYEEAFLKDLPPQFRSLTTVNQEIDMGMTAISAPQLSCGADCWRISIVPKPQEDTHVFCYIHEDLPPIELGV